MEGNLDKMAVENGDPIQYQLPLSAKRLPMNEFIGKEIAFEFTGDIHCCNCGRKTKKSFAQGYCFPCMRKLAETDQCILRPELCHHHLGTCRDEEFAQNQCMKDHIVYLANSSGLKVGITRKVNIPTRWIDQGAIQALPLFKAANRYVSGCTEVLLKDTFNDKTNWRAMLQGKVEPLDLEPIKQKILDRQGYILAEIEEKFGPGSIEVIEDAQPQTFHYPVLQHPEKIKSFNLDKDPTFGGVLQGIKGQYLIFDKGVINIRKYTSYYVKRTN